MTSTPPGQPGYPSANRALPDATDLRLLAALTGAGGQIGLPQAAWNAGIPQAEAAARLVQLAESGFPMRLVLEGDARALRQVVDRGPVVPAAAQPLVPPGAATWGPPGSAAWAVREPARSVEGAAGVDTARTSPQSAPPTPPGHPQETVGLAGERLAVTVTQVLDPADDVLATAGYLLDPGERAVLVHTTIHNGGPAPHDCMPDLYLVLVGANGAVLPKAPVAVAGYPAHRVGVAPGGVADGWTVFLIDSGVQVQAVRWAVRPDLVERTLSWSAR